MLEEIGSQGMLSHRYTVRYLSGRVSHTCNEKIPHLRIEIFIWTFKYIVILYLSETGASQTIPREGKNKDHIINPIHAACLNYEARMIATYLLAIVLPCILSNIRTLIVHVYIVKRFYDVSFT